VFGSGLRYFNAGIAQLNNRITYAMDFISKNQTKFLITSKIKTLKWFTFCRLLNGNNFIALVF
jgi:hypothetical protein